ncbi:M28 family peptidase [Halorientalis litorea]|jgi:Zn-dependent M28 family amino/carboxypeptidase|uniref:M28 family peptidase n=1 Tax=Halorientalis litorea TaxID=2931977 RepID=UPI001FF1D2E0|nr:M28 family peptidase [Halorientalis litorea]
MDWIGDVFTSQRGWSHLESLVDVGTRMAGTDGERRAAELTRDALTEAGARDARITEFPLQGWTRGESRLVADGTEEDCIALPRSPADTATGRFVDAGYGRPEDFEEADCEGAVVMAASDVPEWYDRVIHRREKYHHAVEADAVAFVFRNHVEGCLPPTGSVGWNDDEIGPIPAVGVSKEVGCRVARRFEGEPVTVGVEADIHDATSRNVHAALGPDTDEEVLLTSHVDAHDISEGAMDNGAGTAMLVEVMGALAARESDLDTRVHAIAFGGEEVGLRGSEHHAARTDTDDVRVACNLDGVVRGRTLRAQTHGFQPLADAVETVRDRFDHPIELDPRMGPHSDHWSYVKRGVPACYVLSDTEDRGRGWGHTYADTLDKLDSRDLREGAILVTDLVVELADADRTVSHADTDTVAKALEAQGLAEGMRITGDWPF